jgi:rare lipoprotein A
MKHCRNALSDSVVDVESDKKVSMEEIFDWIGKAKKIHDIIKGSQEEETESDSMGSQSGGASYYSDYFNGRRTANGESFSNGASTCAHRTLPFGTHVTIRNLSNGRTTSCRVNDRGPYASGRVIDLSKAVFQRLGSLSAGVLNVQISW